MDDAGDGVDNVGTSTLDVGDAAAVYIDIYMEIFFIGSVCVIWFLC